MGHGATLRPSLHFLKGEIYPCGCGKPVVRARSSADATRRGPGKTEVMIAGTSLAIVAALGIGWAMLLAGLKKRALNMRGERTCVVCRQPFSRCRCYRT
jgi:hypothetical protein